MLWVQVRTTYLENLVYVFVSVPWDQASLVHCIEHPALGNGG